MKEISEAEIAAIVDVIPDANVVLFCPSLQGHGATLRDRSQYANHGTITSALWKKLPRGLSALSFDGNGDRVDFGAGTSLNLTTKLTIAFWLNLTSLTQTQDGGSPHIISKGSIDASNRAYYVFFSNSSKRIGFVFQKSSTFYQAYPTKADWAAGTWYHIVATFNNTLPSANMVFYFNGASIATGNASGVSIPVSAYNLRMGVRANTTVGINAQIALLLVKNTALSATDVLRLYTRQRRLLGV